MTGSTCTPTNRSTTAQAANGSQQPSASCQARRGSTVASMRDVGARSVPRARFQTKMSAFGRAAEANPRKPRSAHWSQRRRVVRVVSASCLMAIVLSGCSPTYAPLVRAAQYGAPARLTEGQVEVGGSVGGFGLPNVVVPHLAVGLRDWVSLEGGANFNIGGNRDSWALGFLGSRFSLAPHREQRVHFIGDLELGLGGGIGGARAGNEMASKDCMSCDGLVATDRTAWGGYGGVGAGVQIAWFSLYARTRVEASTATNVPATLWPSASLGLEFNIVKKVALTLAGGYLGYTNSADTEHGW